MVAAGRQSRAMDLLAVANGARLRTRNAADLAGLEDHLEVVVEGGIEGLPH